MKVKCSCSTAAPVGELFWARVTDVAKRRRQGLVVCRAALPFEGLFDARPGVALAPTFLTCTNGPGSRAAGVAMAFKFIESAQTRWRAVNAPTSSRWSVPARYSR